MAPGLKWVGEKRPEILFHKGQATLITEPTLLGDDFTGDKVLGGEQTANLYDAISRGEVLEGIENNKSKTEQIMLNFAADKIIAQSTNDTNRLIKEIRKNRPPVDNYKAQRRHDKKLNKIAKHRR